MDNKKVGLWILPLFLPLLLTGCGGNSLGAAGLAASQPFTVTSLKHRGGDYQVGLKYRADTGPAQLFVQRIKGQKMTDSKTDRAIASEIAFDHLRQKKCDMGFKVIAARFDWDGNRWLVTSRVVMDKAFYDGKIPGCK